MEVRARYVLMGVFTLAVVLAGFLFVYWLQAAGGLGERTDYRVRFEGPVAGLLRGSAVFFNGVRVGEVTALTLENDRPSEVIVDIAVDQRVPVKPDTKVTIEFQGIAGAPTLALNGGSPQLPSIASRPVADRMLTSEKDAGQSLSQSAREVLRHIDTVVVDNAEPVKKLIANIETFSAALARNSDKIEGVLSGLERLGGGGPKVSPRIFDLTAAREFPALKAVPQAQLLVVEPTALANFQTEKIIIRDGDKPNLDNIQWPDVLPRVVQARIVESFENAKLPNVLSGSPDVRQSSFQLLIDVRRFDVDAAGTDRRAVVELSARLLDKDGAIVAQKTFNAASPVKAAEPAAAAAELSRAFANVQASLVAWTCEKI